MTVNFSSDDLLRALHTMPEDELLAAHDRMLKPRDLDTQPSHNHWAAAINYGAPVTHGLLSQETLERVRAGLERFRNDHGASA
jgi:hypothetical protein